MTFVDHARWIRRVAIRLPDDATLAALWSAFEIERDPAMRKLLAMALLRTDGAVEATARHLNARNLRALRETLARRW